MTHDDRAAEPAYLALPRRVEAAVVGALLVISLLAWVVDTAPPQLLPTLAGAILVVAGAYQFTPWKRRCLEHCQSPFAFVAHHDFGGGARNALRAGIIHGTYCLGCCWALTLVLLVVGLMNLAWMAVLFVLIYVEKTWRHGLALAKVAGGALAALGIAVAAHPALLELVSR